MNTPTQAPAPAPAAAPAAAAEAATPASAADSTDKFVKARVLIDCAYGAVNTVATVPQADVKQAVAAGYICTNKASVAYALSLVESKAD